MTSRRQNLNHIVTRIYRVATGEMDSHNQPVYKDRTNRVWASRRDASSAGASSSPNFALAYGDRIYVVSGDEPSARVHRWTTRDSVQDAGRTGNIIGIARLPGGDLEITARFSQ